MVNLIIKRFRYTINYCIIIFSVSALSSCEDIPFDWDLPKAPRVTAPNIVSYSPASIELYADCIDDGNDPETVKGFCWSNNQFPDTNAFKYESPETGTGTVFTNISWPSNQPLYIRTYAKNKTAIIYSDQVSVIWPGGPANLPTLTTFDASNIDFTTALMGGQVVSDGGLPIISSGICYSTSPIPTVSNGIVLSNQSGGNLFSFTSSSLTENTTYSFRAFATNLAGTNYGVTKTFTTRNYYSIGELGPKGGVVFYSKSDTLGGWQFLEAAQADSPNTLNWSGSILTATNVINQGIGTGFSNTNTIVSIIGQSSSYAAKYCSDYTFNGASDWFLPSLDELQLIRQNLGQSLASNYNLKNSYYWSSSEDNVITQNAWVVQMQSGSNPVISANKNLTYWVRPIRRFK